MPKKETTKSKIAFSIDIEINKKLIQLAKKFKTKKSRIVNDILKANLLNKHFENAMDFEE